MIETVVRETRRSNGSEKNMSQFSFRGSPNTQVSFQIKLKAITVTSFLILKSKKK